MFVVDFQDNTAKEHHKFYEDEDITVNFERTVLGPVIHCDVSGWSREIKDKTHLILYEFCKEFNSRGIGYISAFVQKEDEKHKKFVSQYGFEFVLDGKDTEGNEYELWQLDTDIGE